MKLFAFPLLSFLLLIPTVNTKAQDSLLIEAIKVHTYALTVDKLGFKGSGAEPLQQALTGKQFLLVGEQHGIVEVGAFTRALYQTAQPQGFKYFCIETDPFIAKKLEEVVGQGESSLAAFTKALPLSIPFYNNPEDFALLETALQSKQGDDPVFWGIDQVFAAAPRYLFQRLIEIAPNQAAKDLAAAYLQKGIDGFNIVMKTGDFTKMLLMQLNGADFEKLYAAFGKDEAAESTQMIDGLVNTKEIYDAWYAGKYHQNNLIRSKLMKKQFMSYYRRAAEKDAQPKVIFKFGATHTYRGLSYYHIFDIGNLAAELAAMNGLESLHIHFSGLQGKANSGLQGIQSFDNQKDVNPVLWEAIKEKAEGKDWIMVDMRPLREKFGRKTLKPLKSEVFNYDFWIFVPQATAVSQFR